MNVSCPECRSVFRVDPAKIPASTVRARCSVCGGVITIAPPAGTSNEFGPPSGAASGCASGTANDPDANSVCAVGTAHRNPQPREQPCRRHRHRR